MVSDWFAQHTGLASVLASLDLAMPWGYAFWGDDLTQTVANVPVPESHLDDMVIRILAA